MNLVTIFLLFGNQFGNHFGQQKAVLVTILVSKAGFGHQFGHQVFLVTSFLFLLYISWYRGGATPTPSCAQDVKPRWLDAGNRIQEFWQGGSANSQQGGSANSQLNSQSQPLGTQNQIGSPLPLLGKS